MSPTMCKYLESVVWSPFDLSTTNKTCDDADGRNATLVLELVAMNFVCKKYLGSLWNISAHKSLGHDKTNCAQKFDDNVTLIKCNVTFVVRLFSQQK